MKSRFLNIVRFFCISMMAGLLSMCFIVDVQADEIEIIYDSGKKSFINGELETQLFDINDVMPGDLLLKTFSIGNSKQGSNPVRLYFRPKKHDETDGTLFTRCQIKVSTVDGKVLYDNEKSGKSIEQEWIFIGEYEPGEYVKLELSVAVPIELENEYMNQEGKIVFDFMAEDLGKTPEKTPGEPPEEPPGEPSGTEEDNRDNLPGIQMPTAAKTEDGGNFVMWSVIAGAALIGGDVVLHLRKKT